MTKHFAVIGQPIAHSLSPLIHKYFAEQIGIELRYTKLELDPIHFSQQITEFFAAGGHGLNVTAPGKEFAYALAAAPTARCVQAQAANTLWYQDGQLYADNTDGVGLVRDLTRHVDLAKQRILILGAGGAMRGVIGPLCASGAICTVASRSPIPLPVYVTLCAWTEITSDYDIVINATSAATNGQTLALPPALLRKGQLAYDLTYHLTHQTPFIAQAQHFGCTTHDGLGMLVEQAAEAFYIWHGTRPNTFNVLGKLRKLD